MLWVLLAACSSGPVPPTVSKARETPAARPHGLYDGVDIGDRPLAAGAASVAALGTALVEALNARSEPGLRALVVTEEEYTARLFPVLIRHASAKKMGAGLVWRNLAGESDGDLRTALQRHGGAGYRFVRLEPAEVEARPKVRIHRKPIVVVRDGHGEEHRLVMLGPVIEHVPSGTWKILSFRDTV